MQPTVACSPVALVTGGAVRVGGAISRALADAGYRLVVNYHSSAAAAEELRDILLAAGGEVTTVQADVSERSQVTRMMEVTLEQYGRLDLVVNNAAIIDEGDFLHLEPERWRRTMEVNLDGPFYVAQAAARIMAAAGGGRIINICGTAGVTPIGAYAPYCAAKAGLDMLTRCMAQALAPAIQVNGIAPGTVLFPEGAPEGDRQRVIAKIPGGAIGRPEDIADAVCFLASAPDYITGTIIVVDGGASLGSA